MANLSPDIQGEMTSEATALVIVQPVLPAPFSSAAPAPVLLAQGAEAHVYRTTFLSPGRAACLKVRPPKPYRHPTLDARLTKQRVLAEARILAKLSGLGLPVPALLSLDWNLRRKVKQPGSEVEGLKSSVRSGGDGAWLLMEWIDGRTVKELLREEDVVFKDKGGVAGEGDAKTREDKVQALLRQVGRAIGTMHSKGGIVHGDLTSSNIMVRPGAETEQNGEVNGHYDKKRQWPNLQGEIVLIDFGLATQSVQDEDRAVDLYVLEKAFGSTHPKQEAWFQNEVLNSPDGYLGTYKGAKIVLRRLEDVRMRGRKRSMVG